MVQWWLRCVVCFYKTKYCGLGNMEKLRRVHVEEKTGIRKWMSSRYYDRPDGQDISGKLCYTTKMAALGGLACGYVYANYPPPTYTSIKLLRMAQIFVPSVGMAVAFTFVTYYATNYRQKDDPVNYMLGGAAAGLLLGPATGMGTLSLFGAIGLGAVGYAKKTSQLNRTRLAPVVKQRELSNYFKKTWDTTLTEEVPSSTWIKEAPTN